MNLVNIEIILIIVSIACVIQFEVLSLAQHFFKNHINVRCIVFLNKFVLLFLCVPAILISNYVMRYSGKFYQTVQGTDFNLLELISIESFETANQNLIFFSVLTGIIWLLGFSFTFLFIAIKEILILKNIRSSSEVLKENESNFLIMKRLEKELNINKKISLYKCDLIDSPFITGVFHPAIFVPTKEFSDDIFSLMLKHELYHYKNKDLLFRKIAVLIKGIYWFNPFVHYFINQFFYNCEMVCDTQTLHNESNDTRSTYAHTILSLIRNQNGLVFVSQFLSNDASHIEKRIENIMKNRINKYKLATVVVSTLIVFMTPATAYASASIITNVQDEYARSIFNEKSNIEQNYIFDTVSEQTGKLDSVKQNIILEKAPRGANLIDVTVNDRTRAVVDSVSFKKGDKVQFILAATNQSDSFKAGITDSNGYSRYVNSSNGALVYTFTITADGSYDLYMQGNTASNVRITGSITL